MKILQIKTTPIALAPDLLSDAINKYTEHFSVVQHPLDKVTDKFDVILFHNKWFSSNFEKQFIMYHSEPFMVDLKIPDFVKKMVIAQYHCTLPEFKDCDIVRNVIDFNDPIYEPKYFDKIKIGYSPSNKGSFGDWHNKGYNETKKILEEIKKKFGSKVEYDIITDVSLEECLKRKSECNIIIDEVVTGSYHRSGLEGLAMGKLTICNLLPQVQDALMKVTGSETIPFYPATLESLKRRLINIIEDKGVEFINSTGKDNRKWMETYWSPQTIINDFIKKFES